MRVRDASAGTRRRARFVAVLAAVAAAGCASLGSPVPPRGWLRPYEVEVRESLGYGVWAAVFFKTQPRRVEGELIAVDSDSVVVLTADGIRVRPTSELRQAGVAVQIATGSTETDWISASDWSRMAKYARFPGGLPPGIEPRDLLPKRGIQMKSAESD